MYCAKVNPIVLFAIVTSGIYKSQLEFTLAIEDVKV